MLNGSLIVSDFSELNRYQRALEAAERRFPLRGIKGGHQTLHFESALERDFLDDRRQQSLPVARVGLALGSVLYILFFAIDALFYGRYLQWWTVVPFLGIAGIGNFLVLWSTFHRRFDGLQSTLFGAVSAINAFAIAFASAWGYKVGLPIPPEAAVIQQLYTFSLLSIPFRSTAPLTLIVVVVFAGLHAMVGMAWSEWFIRSFLMAAAGMLGVFACYMSERAQRLSWLRSRLLQELSEHDSLTGLYNHRVFYQRSEKLLRQARRDGCGVAVLVCDVDHFKRFNDQHGHLAGDDALRQVATALASCARRPLDIAARLGGEEFALLLYNVTPEAAEARAEDVRSIVRGLTLAEGRRVTISIGIACAAPSDERSVAALVGMGDAALYRAKDAGRDRVSR